MKTQTTVDFSEIFHFAEKAPFNVSWNQCNDIFFREEFLTYKGSDEINKKELVEELKYDKTDTESRYLPSEKYILAIKVLIAFMEAHKLEEMLVLND
jgi:hypothetical protein